MNIHIYSKYDLNSSLSCDEVTGDKNDIRRVARRIMNQTASKRVISKQEAMVILGDLDLFRCTETITRISVSMSKRIVVNKDDNSGKGQSYAEEYSKRHISFDEMSMQQYYHHSRNHPDIIGDRKISIPHFTGVNGSARYPVTEDYARHTIIVHKPWRTYPAGVEWIEAFDVFINSVNCPRSAKMAYERVMRRAIDKMTFYDPKAKPGDHTNNPVDDDDEELMMLVGHKADSELDAEDMLIASIDRGINFEWNKPLKVRDL
jgi:hypothetical protein